MTELQLTDTSADTVATVAGASADAVSTSTVTATEYDVQPIAPPFFLHNRPSSSPRSSAMSTSSHSLPLIAVVGATGQQGGSVVRHLVHSQLYRVRAITRKPSSPAAVALAEAGVEVVRANVDVTAELSVAFAGAYAVFAVTNHWDADMGDDRAGRETQQGKNQADACMAAGVQLLIWSSLHDAHSIIRARDATADWDLAHFSSKNRVEQYIRTLPIQAAFVYAGFYTSNWAIKGSPLTPRRLSPTAIEWALGVRADVGLPMFDVDDTGKYVLGILEEPNRYQGQTVLMAAEYMTLAQIASEYARVTGEEATSRYEATRPIRWFNEFGYFNGEQLNTTVLRAMDCTGWTAWLQKTGWKLP